jgi:AraC-like DNA-binding protein
MHWDAGYREFAPPAALRPSVSCLWVGVAPPTEHRTTVVLPDACVDLIWEQGRGAYVAGPDTGPAPATSPPGTIIAGVRFAPGAAGAALRMPMSALLDQRVDAAYLGCRSGASLAHLLPGSLDPGAALGVLIRVAGLMATEGPADPLVAEAARLLRRGPVQAEQVAGHLAVSERQLRRRCQAAVGYGPATLRRVLRFRRFVSWADAGARGTDLAGAAARLGYADQAHLTRECVRLAGLTPAALLAARGAPAPAD